MVEIERLLVPFKPSLPTSNNRRLPAFISPERTRKFELLNHLVLHTHLAVVICGAPGIGKTTLLKALQTSGLPATLICPVVGKSTLSLEKIYQLLADYLGTEGYGNGQLPTRLQQLAKQQTTIALTIDNAGDLPSGLIGQLLQDAANYPALRLVFALSHEELDSKTDTDPQLADCHLLELPALSARQTREYLHYIENSHYDLNDEQTAALYQDTLGIPGRIKALALDPVATRHNPDDFKTLIIAVAVLIVLALATQWYSGTAYNLNAQAISPQTTPNNNS